MKIEIPKEIVERFLICIEYAEHASSCNEGELCKKTFLKIPNCPFLGKCDPEREPIAEVVRSFRKALEEK